MPMSSKNYPPNILEQASTALAACKQIDPALTIGSLTQDTFGALITAAQASQAQITQLELQLLELRNQRDNQLTQLWDTTKRVRATVRGVYGDDSSEYSIVGGTRLSERKRAARRAVTPPAPPLT